MFCAICGDGTTAGSDLCTACQQEQLPDLVSVSAATTGTAQPGWYVDPSDATRQRYWNGSAWASTSHPANSFAYPPGAQPALVKVNGMSFTGAVTSVLTKYVGFSGRARRSEYWWFSLFSNIVALVVFGLALVVDLMTASADAGATDATGLATGGALLVGLVVVDVLLLAMFLPHLAVMIRRLHDTNRSGWFYLITFVPIVGCIILLVVMCEDSTRGPNRYGPSPKYV
jgi:uncharacterized membrane protein YhaH (DUF805 family)